MSVNVGQLAVAVEYNDWISGGMTHVQPVSCIWY